MAKVRWHVWYRADDILKGLIGIAAGSGGVIYGLRLSGVLGDRGVSDLSLDQAMLVVVAAGVWSLVIITILK